VIGCCYDAWVGSLGAKYVRPLLINLQFLPTSELYLTIDIDY